MEKLKRLSAAEREIMDAIWQSGGAFCVNDVFDALGDSEWKYTTVATFLTRLLKKGFLECEKIGKQNYYRASVSRDEYLLKQTDEFLEDMYDGAAGSFIAYLCRDKVSAEDYEEIMEILKKYDK